MKNIKVVIGANFGDEGKGLLTDYFTRKSDGNVLNVLYNGGVQRGHTAQNHVFHCFGSGTLSGADTFCDRKFMINPIGWVLEGKELSPLKGNFYIHQMCRVTTPFDMIINQRLETKRGADRHGSCGMGIYETVLRSRIFPIYAYDLENQDELYRIMKVIQNSYFPKRCHELEIDDSIDFSIDDFMTASHLMMKYSIVVPDLKTVSSYYDTVIFEGGQGLLLSEDNTEYFPHLTPSHTGSKYIADFINAAGHDVEVEVCYVTRSYMTRHGVGRFDTECKKEDINPAIVDKTNQHNEYQQGLRFGYLDLNDLETRIKNDLAYYRRPVTVSFAVTQLNYTNGKLYCGDGIYIDPSEIIFADKTYKFDSQTDPFEIDEK